MLRNLLILLLAVFTFSCGTELDVENPEVPENGNYVYTSTVKYYKVPGGTVETEQQFQGYITLSTSGFTGSIGIQPEYGENWTLNVNEISKTLTDSVLMKIPEQNVNIGGEDYSVVGMKLYENVDGVYHVIQTSDSLFIHYNSFLPVPSAEYKYTEGLIKAKRFR